MLTQLNTREWGLRQSIGLWRLDRLTQAAIGNKYYKLHNNLSALAGCRVMTFGGAFSNHLYAFATMAKQYRIQPVAVIRGDSGVRSEVLNAVSQMGMQLHFVSRGDYRQRHDSAYQAELAGRLGAEHILPEGGSNLAAVLGCKQIIGELNRVANYPSQVAVSVGTGATFAGMVAGAEKGQRLTGICVVNDPDTPARIARWQLRAGAVGSRALVAANARYANPDDATLLFVLQVFAQTGIVLDPVYNGPVLHRLLLGDLRDCDIADDLVFVVTGGLTGAWGMRARFSRLGQRRTVAGYFSRINEMSVLR